MNLNRGLIKSQAKQLIKNKVFKLFLVFFVVSFCVSFISGTCNAALRIYASTHGISNDYGDYFDDYEDPFEYGDDYDSDYYNDFGEGEDFFNFGGKITPAGATAPLAVKSTYNQLSSLLSLISNISMILLAPLTVTLSIFYVWFVRGKEYETGAGIEIVFKEAFKNNYLKKLLVSFLRGVLITALGCLFIIPGVIFYYSSYFAFELMCDYPELSSWEAIKLSKKMIKGHRGELFVLDLSFIGWDILCVFILPMIYVTPYSRVTKALYYENFRLRALQLGELTEDDFLSEQQRFAKYASSAGMGSNPYNTNGAPVNANPYSATNQQYGMGGGVGANPFGIPNQNSGGYTQPQNTPPQGGYYQPPVQQAPQQPYFQPPVSQPAQPPVQNAPQGGYYRAPAQQEPQQQPVYTQPTEQPQPTFTITEPVAPQEPTYAEVVLPEEPVETFNEPVEPTEPTDISNE